MAGIIVPAGNEDLVTLLYIEVTPLNFGPFDPQHTNKTDFAPTDDARISAALVKLQLSRLASGNTVNRSLFIRFDGLDGGDGKEAGSASVALQEGLLFFIAPAVKSTGSAHEDTILLVESDDPLVSDPIPCICKGFIAPRKPAYKGKARVVMTAATLVHILPHISPLSALTGETQAGKLHSELESDVLNSHNPETIRQIDLRLQKMLAKPIFIGTTHDALQLRRRCQERRIAIRNALVSYTGCKTYEKKGDEQTRSWESILHESCALIHSPYHGGGKTTLINILAHRVGCARVHIVRAGPLLAKYGVQADAALQAIIHMASIAAAVRNQAICIILDQLESMLPASMSNRSTAGDAASPVLSSIASYLRILSSSMKEQSELPYPMSNPLYNLSGEGGVVLPVRICLVGICTCPDDGWRSETESMTSGQVSSIFDCLLAGRYRIPDLSRGTRLSALRQSLQQHAVILSNDLNERLALITASALWIRGRVFRDIALSLRQIQDARGQEISVLDFKAVLAKFYKANAGWISGTDIEFTPQQPTDWFESVGGNNEAKKTLMESLMLDRDTRSIFNSLGLKPPVGILLYGPPGTGKTLLARTVAQILRASDASALGGTFISVSSRDVVNAEVGTGEKMLMSAFDTARSNAPAVVFIDEFQALFVERNRSGTGRLSTTLFHCMDSLYQWLDFDSQVGDETTAKSESRILVLAATNTPWMVDKAFLRPGRFDRAIHVALPVMEERVAILRLSMKRMKHGFPDDEDVAKVCQLLASDTKGFSGADLECLCRRAAVEALKDDSTHVTLDHFAKARATTRPSCPKSIVTKIERWSPR